MIYCQKQKDVGEMAEKDEYFNRMSCYCFIQILNEVSFVPFIQCHPRTNILFNYLCANKEVFLFLRLLICLGLNLQVRLDSQISTAISGNSLSVKLTDQHAVQSNTGKNSMILSLHIQIINLVVVNVIRRKLRNKF